MLLLAAVLAVSSDPAQVAPRDVQPASDPGSWITPNDYPKAALRARAAGVTGFVLQVGPDGQVTNCWVRQTSGNDGLDAATCALIGDRARFIPALDADGEPIASTYRNAVKWQLPKPVATELPLVPMSAALEFDVSGDGHPSDCKTSGSVPTPSDATRFNELCQGYISGMKFKPPSSVPGKPASKHVVVRIDVSISDISPIIDTPPPHP